MVMENTLKKIQTIDKQWVPNLTKLKGRLVLLYPSDNNKHYSCMRMSGRVDHDGQKLVGANRNLGYVNLMPDGRLLIEQFTEPERGLPGTDLDMVAKSVTAVAKIFAE